MDARNKFSSVVLMLLLAVALASGCTSQGEQSALSLSSAQQTELSTPEPSPTEGVVVSDDDEDVTASQVVSSDAEGGTSIGSGGKQRVPGKLPGGEASSGGLTARQGEKPVDWRVYRNEKFGFEIQYPSVYVVVQAPKSSESLPLRPLAQVLFQDRQLAQGRTADLEPPQFSVRVFDNSSQMPIEKWLRTHNLVADEAGWEIEPYSLSGVSGVQVCTQSLLAPRCSIYLPKGNYVYELTPLGTYAHRMIASFRFTR